ncbi:uncharacterized protein ASCRUDRAFT_75496 [Ascoidea rubescens DSM 1968]|uniref:Uncharacterized protein n=1 Tax=Ascoidea rubescens DSM 1968 TaxID=1344418 RepID=A0A1D2VIZ3_9ASCO|nr:hypothetical protein ASCRUDRAFT_75496 [Ascoidea rubescens DSM 1968]ODV61493.1 hypothetical protein ASCRUDRAFT_75496 [Ascoidea rubescens DSM 1968]
MFAYALDKSKQNKASNFHPVESFDVAKYSFSVLFSATRNFGPMNAGISKSVAQPISINDEPVNNLGEFDNIVYGKHFFLNGRR